MEQVLIILTVPAEFSDAARAIMRDCAFQANLIATKNTQKLQFVTERKFLFLEKLKIRNYFVFKLFIN